MNPSLTETRNIFEHEIFSGRQIFGVKTLMKSNTQHQAEAALCENIIQLPGLSSLCCFIIFNLICNINSQLEAEDKLA